MGKSYHHSERTFPAKIVILRFIHRALLHALTDGKVSNMEKFLAETFLTETFLTETFLTEKFLTQVNSKLNNAMKKLS